MHLLRTILLFSLVFSILLTPLPLVSPTAHAARADSCISEWTVVPSPTSAEGPPELERAGGSAPNNVWAVGNVGNNTFTQHWDGTAWGIVPSPNVTDSAHRLKDVAVLSETDAWAVGTSADSDAVAHHLILHWDGSGWTIVSPTTGDDVPGILLSVSGVAADDVWAVGSSGDEGLIRHWNGAEWETVASPGDLEFLRVIAKSANEVWTLGTDPEHNATILRWNGLEWTVETSFPLLNDGNTYPFQFEIVTDFVVPSPNSIWVIGNEAYKGQWSPQRWYWDGANWTSELPIQYGSSVEYLGIAGVSRDELWTITKIQMTQSTELSHRTNGGWQEYDLTPLIPYPTRAKIAFVPGNEFWIFAESERGEPIIVHGVFTCTAPPPDTAILVEPAPGEIITVMRPTFVWQDTANTAFFKLEVTQVVNPNDPMVRDIMLGTTFAWDRILGNGEHRWRIQACNFVGCGEWSDPVTWTQQVPAPTQAPQIIYPASGATIHSDRFSASWGLVSDATFYTVEIYEGSTAGPLFKQFTTIETSSMLKKLQRGVYYWRVTACNPGECGPWSDMSEFKIAKPLPPTLSIPAPKAVVNMRRPHFIWEISGEGLYYSLQLRNQSRKGSIVGTVETDQLNHFRWREILPYGQYHWRVKACNGMNECSKWSKGRKFDLVK